MEKLSRIEKEIYSEMDIQKDTFINNMNASLEIEALCLEDNITMPLSRWSVVTSNFWISATSCQSGGSKDDGLSRYFKGLQ